MPARISRAWSEESKRKLSESRKRLIKQGKLRVGYSKITKVPLIKVPDDFGNWLSGFIDGEGCFAVAGKKTRLQPIFVLTLRRDDEDIVKEIHRRWGGIGTVTYRVTGIKGTPAVTLRVHATAHCMALVDFFTRYPLRAKKVCDFEVWKQIVDYAFHTYRPVYADCKALVDQLSAVKRMPVIAETA